MAGAGNLDRIDHFVVLMLENRSLDTLAGFLYENDAPQHFLGKGDPVYRGVAGRDDLANEDNEDPPNRIPIRKAPYERQVDMTQPYPCPGEVYQPHVNMQVYGQDVVDNDVGRLPDPAPLNGFVKDYIRVIGSSKKWDGGVEATFDHYRVIMDCFPPEAVPVMTGLARGFAISDAWYSSVPTETFPNRSFIHSGTSKGKVSNENNKKWVFHNDQKTIFERLSEKFSPGKDWRVYWDHHDIVPITRLLHAGLRESRYDDNFRDYADFANDCAAGELPPYTFLEPRVFVNPNDMHPPYYLNPFVDSSVTAGELLVNEVYEAVRHGKNWDRTLLIITFDEHGGCYDHCSPPLNATPPGDVPPEEAECGFRFDRFGLRIPTILVSPLIEAGTVVRSPTGTVFDHTSVIRSLCLRFGVEGLTDRDRAAPDVGLVLTRDEPRADAPTLEPRPYVPMPEPKAHDSPLSRLHHEILGAVAAHLYTELPKFEKIGEAIKHFGGKFR